MDNALPMGSIECIANLRCVVKSLSNRQRTSEYRPFDVLHDQVVRPDIVQRANVRVIQRSYGVRFALEPFGELFVRNFDRDNAIQPCIASFVDFPFRQRQGARGSRTAPTGLRVPAALESINCTVRV